MGTDGNSVRFHHPFSATNSIGPNPYTESSVFQECNERIQMLIQKRIRIGTGDVDPSNGTVMTSTNEFAETNQGPLVEDVVILQALHMLANAEVATTVAGSTQVDVAKPMAELALTIQAAHISPVDIDGPLIEVAVLIESSEPDLTDSRIVIGCFPTDRKLLEVDVTQHGVDMFPFRLEC